MPIDLYKYSSNFKEASNNNYLLIVGRKNKLLSISLRLYIGEFTHISGLEHLPTIFDKVDKNTKKKELLFKDFLNKRFIYSNLKNQDLTELVEPKPKTYNYATKQEYTLEDRFNKFSDIDVLLKDAYKGSFYKWDNSKDVILPNKKRRKSTVGADYVLVLPSNSHADERLYLFLVDENKSIFAKNEKSSTLNLKLISAFADCKELLNGQEKPYTILNYEIEDKNHNKTTIFTHPNFKPTTLPVSTNIKNSTQFIKPLDIDTDVITKSVALELPNLVELVSKVKNTISNTYKKMIDKISKVSKKNNSSDDAVENYSNSENTETNIQGNLSWDSFNQTDETYNENVVKNPYKVEGCTPDRKSVV